jgi:hypothetical protein
MIDRTNSPCVLREEPHCLQVASMISLESSLVAWIMDCDFWNSRRLIPIRGNRILLAAQPTRLS